MNLAQIADEVSKEIVFGKVISNNPTVIVLAGLQYSGKSYLANNITDKNYSHFWATNIKKKYGIKNPEMIEVAKLVISSVVSEGFNLVIDFVNHKYDIRKQFQDTANRLDVGYKVVFIDTPKEVRLERREKNVLVGDQPGRRVISLDQMNEFENEFEIPNENENVIILRSQDDIDLFLETL
ncbi:MAG: AAA family ATPase [Oscillospiraceae bacterium]